MTFTPPVKPTAPVIRIATRESRLALWQAQHVQARLQDLGAQVHILGMTTQGDQILDRTLAQVGGKGLFVKELEQALLAGHAEVAVHSLKDLPMDLPAGLTLAAIAEREDPRDAWVSNDYASVDALPVGAVVGTASMRRRMLLQQLRPDLRIMPLRGNLDTRLKKLDAGNYAGIVLAVAGLKRLGLQARIRTVFGPEQMLPAPGQGALGLELREDADATVWQLVQQLHHPSSALRVLAERALSRALGGSCSIPLAGYAQWQQDASGPNQLHLRAILGRELTAQALPNSAPSHAENSDASRFCIVQAHAQARVENAEQAEALGQDVAQQLQQRMAIALNT